MSSVPRWSRRTAAGLQRQILEAFTDGIAGRPETTFGNVKADVLEHFVPGFRRGDFVEVIQSSDWPE